MAQEDKDLFWRKEDDDVAEELITYVDDNVLASKSALGWHLNVC
jgi:hypothetical protein